MKKPRLLLWFIIAVTIFSILIGIPRINKIDPQFFLRSFIGSKELSFRKGLDLEGGTSIKFKADIKEVPNTKRDDALRSAKTVIEKRVNLFGVSEPVIQTAKTGNDYRIIVEIPGVTDSRQAIDLIGTTAELSFWEEGATLSAKLASPSAIPVGISQFLGANPKKTNLLGRDLDQSIVTFDPNSGRPQVALRFTSDGAKKFAEITKRNVNKPLAIVLDNQLIEVPPPRVNEPILDGNAVITGAFTTEQAKALSIQLNAGALPVPLLVLEQHAIGATLGSSSLQKSLFAGVLGFIIIVIFMTVLYGKLGVLASIALLLYTLFVLAIFKISTLTPYGITLTLSGIAGFILSIGMAVDANILIFERMKEEIRMGRRREDAIELGFSRAWTSIRDSNASTLLTSLVLYKFGTGVVRGFALVLAIGVLVSMFSAIVVTRTFLRIVYK